MLDHVWCGLLVDVAGSADYWACREEARPTCGFGGGECGAGGAGTQGWGGYLLEFGRQDPLIPQSSHPHHTPSAPGSSFAQGVALAGVHEGTWALALRHALGRASDMCTLPSYNVDWTPSPIDGVSGAFWTEQ